MILACLHRLTTGYPQVIQASMGLFATNKAVERLRDRLETLEVLTGELERDRRKLDLEFTDLYDKVRHQMSRMAKRAATANKENGFDTPEPEIPDHLAHLDPISRSIMIRRGGTGLKK